MQDSLWRIQVKRVSRLRVPTCEKFLHKPDGVLSWLYFSLVKSRFYTSIYQLFTYSNLPSTSFPRPSQVFFTWESTFCASFLRTKVSFGSIYILPRLHIRKCEHLIIAPVSQRDLQQESTTHYDFH